MRIPNIDLNHLPYIPYVLLTPLTLYLIIVIAYYNYLLPLTTYNNIVLILKSYRDVLLIGLEAGPC